MAVMVGLSWSMVLLVVGSGKKGVRDLRVDA